ncbi:hypothetical protein MTR67_052183 [Solanum verrucosum]|uniref:Ubiquitin-like protease family profile domain-containing protein n=1 Tax=Solanum verrucosum TaxID=315347 RepID=A0AAF0V8T4_SOLVR|nr:hypothetical protein MTR67_052183 [Solanum verrucosum]
MKDKGDRYKKKKVVLQMWFHFGIATVQNKNWFYKLAYKDQLLDDSVSDSTEESILEYINGYRMHVVAPWHTIDNILISINVFHWILIVVSFNDRCIQIYDSLSGGALHDSYVENEIKKSSERR